MTSAVVESNGAVEDLLIASIARPQASAIALAALACAVTGAVLSARFRHLIAQVSRIAQVAQALTIETVSMAKAIHCATVGG